MFAGLTCTTLGCLQLVAFGFLVVWVWVLMCQLMCCAVSSALFCSLFLSRSEFAFVTYCILWFVIVFTVVFFE